MNPIEQRDALLADLARLRRQASLESGEVHRARAEAAQAKRRAKDALVDDFRVGDGETAVEARKESNAAARAVYEAEERAEAAAQAARNAEQELEALHAEHFATFTAEGEAVVQEAVTALLEAEAPLRRAHEAWMKATATWAPINPLIRKYVIENAAERGFHPGREHIDALSRVPAFPLTTEFAVFESARRGGIAPRPQALKLPRPRPVEVTDAAEEAV